MRSRYVFTIMLFLATLSVMAHNEIIYFSEVTYFDNNADGFIDSIVMVSTGPIQDTDASAFEENIQLPDWRNFTIRQVLIFTENTVVFLVREWRSIPVTSVTSNDYFLFRAANLPSGGKIGENTLLAKDRVAPVLQSAQLVSYGNVIDSLQVVFSEKIRPFNHSRPFLFQSPTGTSYIVNLISTTISDSIVRAIPDNINSMNEGDSVWINTAASITDLVGNVQSNPANRRVHLTKQAYSDVIVFSTAAYYDQNADGFIDSIVISTSDTIKESDLSAIRGLITLPPTRNFNIESIRLVESKIVLIVTENNVEPNTGVDGNDLITITQGIIPWKTVVMGATIQVQDSVAPVILWAQLDAHDIGDDTILIRFSEQVQRVTYSQPFHFLRTGQGTYEVVLQSLTLNQNERFTGHVVSVELDSIRVGDSVWINTAALISDGFGNVQRNPDNRRVSLTINLLDFPVVFTEAAYFDANADGLVDRIKLWYDGPLYIGDLQRLRDLITLPSLRYFTIDTITKMDSVLTILVKEHSKIPRTSILSADRIVIKSGHLPEGGITMDGTLTVLDSLKPVIISAHLDWYNNDQQILRVTFSEPVKKIFSNKPFLFINPENGLNNVTLRIENRISNSNFTGQVYSKTSNLKENDSCWINEAAQISDLENNIQTSYVNRKVLLTIRYRFDLRFLAENNPYSEGKRPIPQPVQQAYVNNNVQMPSDGMVIIVDSDQDLPCECSFQGTVSIYDVVQNPVIQKKKMIYDKETNRLYFVWDGRNYNGRDVGAGTYLAVIKVNATGQKYTKKMNIGVKR